MIIYKSSTTHFDHDVRYNKIVNKLESEFLKITGRHVAEAERRSWKNSLSKMNEVLLNEKLNEKDCGVLIEYQLPQSSMRLDFMITGKDKFLNTNAVIVELKQWDKVSAADTDRQVVTYTGGSNHEVNHPSVQVTKYKEHLMDYHSAFHPENENAVVLYTCAYLHNFPAKKADTLLDLKFKYYTDSSPIFMEEDTKKIGTYIVNHVNQGDGLEILDYIEAGITKPSKKLINHINNILDAKSEFILMDNQLVVFDRVMQIVQDKKLDGTDGKYVVLVKGGPGTGKSVVGLNLLAKILRDEKDCVYLAANAAFKNGMANKLDKDRAKRLFKHPYFYNKELIINDLCFQTAIIDEAHRISETPPPMQKKLVCSLIEGIIEKTHLSVFFSDDNQMIRPKDIGSYTHIKEVAQSLNCQIYEYELDAQFRCAGSDGYINWLDDVLGIKETANASGWENLDQLEFTIMDTPDEMIEELRHLQKEGHSSRMVAGYSWPWSKKLEEGGHLVNDVKIYNDDQLVFEMPWNPQESYSEKRAKGIPLSGADWAVNPFGVNQIGCIHTCQGLEFDYVGVIIGEELTYNQESHEWQADATKCHDSKIGNNCKDFLRLTQNTYKTLLTRGIKGVFVYAVDPDTQAYLKSRLNVVKDFEKMRFYHSKETTLQGLFVDGISKIAESTQYTIEKLVSISNYNISPMQGVYYYCDLLETQVAFDNLSVVEDNKDSVLDEKLKKVIEETPQIRYYAHGKIGLKVDIGFMIIQPEVFVKRLLAQNEIISMVFKKG